MWRPSIHRNPRTGQSHQSQKVLRPRTNDLVPTDAADHSKAPPNLGDGFLENPSGPPPKRGDGLGNSLNFTLFVEAAGPRLELLRRPLGPLEPQAWHSPAQEPTPGATTSLNGERPSSMESLELGRTARPARQHRTLGLFKTRPPPPPRPVNHPQGTASELAQHGGSTCRDWPDPRPLEPPWPPCLSGAAIF